jgi:hypothetical protein
MGLLLQNSTLGMVCVYHNMLVLLGTGHRGAKQAHVNLAIEALLFNAVYSETITLLSQERRSHVCPRYLFKTVSLRPVSLFFVSVQVSYKLSRPKNLSQRCRSASVLFFCF